MRTQIAKSGFLPAEYILPTFLTRGTLPLLRRLTRRAAIPNNFLFFSWLRSYSDSYSILFRISVVLTHYKFSLDILLVYILSILSRLRFLTSLLIFDSYFLFSRPVFTRINFDLFQHCRFYTLTLLLVINKHLCLWEFVLCLFLAILRLSDVFSSYLGVVYCLWLK